MELPYLAYFNLREEPFSTVPSPRYFFLTTAHGTALEKTAYVVGAKKGLAAVFGDTGTGKSSLARLLYQKFLDSGFLVSLLTNPSYPTPNSFLRTIAQEFGTPKTDKSFKGMLDIFKEYLIEQAVQEKKTVVLIIDEAQTLKPPLIELLRQLVNFETNDMKLLQLVLFAQEELRDTLARPKLRNFRSRIAMASTLERLGLEELEAMLKFRWEVASGGAGHPFTREAIEAIFEASAGMPREANILADNALLLAYYQKQRQIQREQVEQVAADRWENLNRREAAA
ncbi:MAG: AAA family ATPase [Thermoproteota archaeon]|nr:AAA family ATPase [Thermoproteota archaeon]